MCKNEEHNISEERNISIDWAVYAGFSRTAGFNPRSLHVRVLVERMTLDWVPQLIAVLPLLHITVRCAIALAKQHIAHPHFS